MFAIYVALLCAVDTARVNLAYILVITITYRFLCVVLERDPRTSMVQILVVDVTGKTEAATNVCIRFRS